MTNILLRCAKCAKEYSARDRDLDTPCPRCGGSGEFVREYEPAISGGAWPPDYDKIDQECRALVRGLNMLPGLQTRECCSGHAQRSLWILVYVEDLESIAGLLDILKSYLRGEEWEVRVESSPPGRSAERVWFRLVSKDHPGQASYQAAEDLAMELMAARGLELYT